MGDAVGNLTALHHVAIAVSNTDKSADFAQHFGLITAQRDEKRVYLRGVGSDSYNLVLERAEQPGVVSIAFAAEDGDALERFAKAHGAPVVEIGKPFGGYAVSLRDPDGNRIDIVHGIQGRTPDELRSPMMINQGYTKDRRGVTQTKPALGPPALLRLGHVGLFVSNYRASDQWYRQVLGVLPSDLMYAGPKEHLIAGFYRLNRGSHWVDHHTVAMFGMGPKKGLHHLSFEVQDSEAQFIGHRWMKRHGHTPVWGVGRHQLGSHIFDVWRDPDGHRFETYSDTDLLTVDHEPALSPVENVGLDLWSDEHFQKYFD
jgi:catechol 2,3-dioxygenase-like lactoylglutathione lyase family enzyme